MNTKIENQDSELSESISENKYRALQYGEKIKQGDVVVMQNGKA